MDKKSYLFLGIAAVVIIAVVIILATANTNQDNQGANNNAPQNVVTVPNEQTGAPVVVEIPERAMDSSELSEVELEAIPLNEEAFITFGPNGLETTTIRAKNGARVFLTFSATDDKEHLFLFADESMEAILVMFSKAEGPKSINFLAPGPGVYEFSVDDIHKGQLIVE